jgi:hypothetical protein
MPARRCDVSASWLLIIFVVRAVGRITSDRDGSVELRIRLRALPVRWVSQRPDSVDQAQQISPAVAAGLGWWEGSGYGGWLLSRAFVEGPLGAEISRRSRYSVPSESDCDDFCGRTVGAASRSGWKSDATCARR